MSGLRPNRESLLSISRSVDWKAKHAAHRENIYICQHACTSVYISIYLNMMVMMMRMMMRAMMMIEEDGNESNDDGDDDDLEARSLCLVALWPCGFVALRISGTPRCRL